MTTLDTIAALARLIYPRPPRSACGHGPEVEAEHLVADDGWHVVLLVGLPGDLSRVVARGHTEAVALDRAHATMRREATAALSRARHDAARIDAVLHPTGAAYLNPRGPTR